MIRNDHVWQDTTKGLEKNSSQVDLWPVWVGLIAGWRLLVAFQIIREKRVMDILKFSNYLAIRKDLSPSPYGDRMDAAT